MATKLRYPLGNAWPAEMRADMAAAYVDEPSPKAFLDKVGTIYPQPVRNSGTAHKWSKEALDKTVAQRHNLLREEEDICELI